MKHRLTAIAMAGTIAGTFVLIPTISSVMAKEAHKQSSPQLIAAETTRNNLQDLDVKGILSDGGKFSGTVSIKQFAYDDITETLSVTFVLNGVAKKADGEKVNLENVELTAPATLSQSNSKETTCDVLFLDIGPISLDLLGLTLDLSEIKLNIDAVSGSGNLLGNLLCSLASLLDGGGLLTDILNVISQINDILSSV